MVTLSVLGSSSGMVGTLHISGATGWEPFYEGAQEGETQGLGSEERTKPVS